MMTRKIIFMKQVEICRVGSSIGRITIKLPSDKLPTYLDRIFNC